MDLLVTSEWLAGELGAVDLVVIDATVYLAMGPNGYESESGRTKFEEAHIPGARFGDLIGDLCDAESPDRFALPTPAALAAAFERLGVRDGSRVVLYDDNGSMWAARVWFMLRWLGFDDAAILDGGMRVWRDEGRPTEAGSAEDPAAAAGSLTVSLRPRLVADKDEVMAAMTDGATCLIDALPAPVFNGEVAPYGRPGHIPTAINVSAAGMIDQDTGRFRPLDDIRHHFPERPEARVVAY